MSDSLHWREGVICLIYFIVRWNGLQDAMPTMQKTDWTVIRCIHLYISQRVSPLRDRRLVHLLQVIYVVYISWSLDLLIYVIIRWNGSKYSMPAMQKTDWTVIRCIHLYISQRVSPLRDRRLVNFLQVIYKVCISSVVYVTWVYFSWVYLSWVYMPTLWRPV